VATISDWFASARFAKSPPQVQVDDADPDDVTFPPLWGTSGAFLGALWAFRIFALGQYVSPQLHQALWSVTTALAQPYSVGVLPCQSFNGQLTEFAIGQVVFTHFI
jgi:hypothetical protein